MKDIGVKVMITAVEAKKISDKNKEKRVSEEILIIEDRIITSASHAQYELAYCIGIGNPIREDIIRILISSGYSVTAHHADGYINIKWNDISHTEDETMYADGIIDFSREDMDRAFSPAIIRAKQGRSE